MKKFITLVLIFSMCFFNYLPAYAIKNVQAEDKTQTVNIAFWQGFKDEYLEGYILKALNENQDLKIATLRVEEARQNVKLQFSKELPSAQIGVSPFLSKTPLTTSTMGSFSIPMMVSYEADIFLKNHDKTKSVKKIFEAVKFNERAIYLAVSSEIGATYFNIVKLDKLISLQEEIIKDRETIFKLMKVRNELGLTSTADKVRAEKAYVLAVSEMSDLNKSRGILLNSLAVMIGESPNNSSDLERISYDKLVELKAVPETVSSEVITQRPDYLTAEKMLKKAGIGVRVAKKEFLPNINILGLLSMNTFSSSSSMNWANALAAVGGSAMLPLFTGEARIANLKLMKNRYEQVLQNYYKTNLNAIKEVNIAMLSSKSDNEKYLKNVDAYNMQKQDYNYMDIRYKNGLISNLDLIQQKETLLTLDKAVTSSKIECYIDQISLYKAVGGRVEDI